MYRPSLVAILGRSPWEWGRSPVTIIRVDDLLFGQLEQRDGETEADPMDPEDAYDRLTSRGSELTEAGRAWLKAQRALYAKYRSAMDAKDAA